MDYLAPCLLFESFLCDHAGVSQHAKSVAAEYCTLNDSGKVSHAESVLQRALNSMREFVCICLYLFAFCLYFYSYFVCIFLYLNNGFVFVSYLCICFGICIHDSLFSQMNQNCWSNSALFIKKLRYPVFYQVSRLAPI